MPAPDLHAVRTRRRAGARKAVLLPGARETARESVMSVIRCEYVADTSHESSHGHTDAEVIQDPGGSVETVSEAHSTVYCTAEAKRVIRPKGRSINLGNPHRTKRVVCEAHGRYLVGAAVEERPDDYREWEFDAADPEDIIQPD